MNLLDRARRLEQSIAGSITAAAQKLSRAGTERAPLEVVHAIVDAVEREIQSGPRGNRVFPFNAIDVQLAAPSEHARARLDVLVNGDLPLRDRVMDRLRAAGCAVDDLEVTVGYVARAPRHWTDPQFAVAFSRNAPRRRPKPAAAPKVMPRLEVRVVHGDAPQPAYVLASERIDLGRGSDVRDTRGGLIRTNHVAFADTAAGVNQTISRQHCHIAYDGGTGQFRVHDDGSVHGTKIMRNGKTVPVPCGARGVRLQTGDEIVLGEGRLAITVVGGA